MQYNYWQFFTENWFLIVLFFGILYFILKLEMENSELALSIQDATVWINRENAVMLDIREKEKYESGHIAGAKHVELAFPEKNSPWDKFKKKKIILVCGDGRISKRLVDKIADAVGHKNVKYLRGGILAWQDENLPLTATS